MRRDAMYGGALIVGALASVLTMAMHPTGSQLIADVQHVAPLGLAVHTLALAALPRSFFGAIRLTRVLRSKGDAALAAPVAYGMASVDVMIAAVAGGLLAPALAAQLVASTGSEHDLAAALFHYTVSVNQAFAKVLVMASSVAILIWSALSLAHGRLARPAGLLGGVVGALAMIVVAIGHLRLDVHGFGAVVLCQGLWMITVGTLLVRAHPAIEGVR